MNHFRSEPLGQWFLNTSTTDFRLNTWLRRIFCNPWTLLIFKVLIGVVSAYDIYLTVKYVNSLPAYELNPIGRWLMELDRGPECDLKQVAGFITAKFAGNFIVLCILELLASWKYYIASAVALPVAVFQLGLLYYLVCGTN